MKRRRFMYFCGSGVFAFLCTACLPLPVQEKVPQIASNPQWKETIIPATVTQEECLGKDRWWEVYEDQTLNELIEKGLENSPSIQQALSRLDQAFGFATIVGADRFPNVGLNGYASRRRIPKDLQGTGSVLTGDVITPTTQAPLPVPYGISPIVLPAVPGMQTVKSPVHVNNLIADLLISYEFDFWGKYYLQEKAAVKRTEAAAADVDTAKLLLADQIATTYFSVQAYQEQLRLLQDEIVSQRQFVSLLKKRLESGMTNTFDLLVAQANLEMKQSEEAALFQNISVNKSLLAVLIGEDPNSFSCEVSSQPWKFPIVPVELPASVLLRRPDVLAYKDHVEALVAEIGAAKAELLPALSLSLALGYQSNLAHEWLKWKNRIWDLVGSVTQPVFDAGKRFGQIDLVKAQYKESCALYTHAVLSSVKEVEDAMVAIRAQQKRREATLLREQELSDIYTLRNALLDTGVDNALVVLEDYIRFLESRRQRIQEEYNLQLGTLALIKSLGGGFTPTQSSC